jgi:hypothetical protein
MPSRWGYELTNKMADWTPTPSTPYSQNDPTHKALMAEQRKLKYMHEHVSMKNTDFDTELGFIRSHIAKGTDRGLMLKPLTEDDILDLAKRVTTEQNVNADTFAATKIKQDKEFPTSRRQEITDKYLKKYKVTSITKLDAKQNKALADELDAFQAARDKAGRNPMKEYQKGVEHKLRVAEFKQELLSVAPHERAKFIEDFKKNAELTRGPKALSVAHMDDEGVKKATANAIADVKAELEAMDEAAKTYKSPNDSFTGESKVEVAVRKAKAGLGNATEKTKKVGGAVGGAVKKTVSAVIPGTGPATSTPSPVVRPTANAPIVAPVAPKPATPVPAGLPPPPSAANPPLTAAPAASTPPAGFSGTTAREGGGTISMPAADDAQSQLARLNGRGGVSGVSRDGIQVEETTEEFLARTRGTGKEGVHKVNKKAMPNASYEPTVRVETQPVDPAVTARNATRRAQLELQAKTGKLPPASGALVRAEEGSLLNIAKRQLPTVFKVVDAFRNIGENQTVEQKAASAKWVAEQKVKADAKAALENLDKNPVAVKPEKVFYNPQSGRSGIVSPEATPAQGRAIMSSFGDRLTKTLYSDILPYASGEPMKAEIAKLFGEGATQRSFLERALKRSGRFTPEEIQVAWRSIMNNPDAMARLTPAIGHLPAEGQPLPNQPLQSGGAPKPFPQRPTGNSLPKVTPVEQTARDRLAAQRQLQAEAQARAVAEAQAAQDAELLRIAAEEKAAFDQLKHDRLVAAASAKERQALIDDIKARSPAGDEDAWKGTPWANKSAPMDRGNSATPDYRAQLVKAQQKNIRNLNKDTTLINSDEYKYNKWLRAREILESEATRANAGKPRQFARPNFPAVRNPNSMMPTLEAVAPTLRGLGQAARTTGVVAGAVLTPLQIYDQIKDANNPDQFISSYRGSDPLSLRPWMDLGLDSFTDGIGPALEKYKRVVNDPRYIEMNPISSIGGQAVRGNTEYLKSFLNNLGYYGSGSGWFDIGGPSSPPPMPPSEGY